MNIRNYSLLRVVVVATLAMSLGACGKKGVVKLELASLEGVAQVAQRFELIKDPMKTFELEAGLTALVPTKFEMKILQAYVVEDVNAETQDNVGKVSRIWVHEDCADPNTCKPADVDYFDLTDPTAANAALNSQAREIALGTYRYVRLEFCVGTSETPNVRFTYNNESFEKTYGGCGATSAALATPIELGADDAVTIQLAYDLTDGEVYRATDNSGDCTDSAPCLGGIDLVPSLAQ